ncbi:putative protein kinase RLK-Pelle-LRR-III family [Helianthus annuus]|uniref:probable inactive receptor kinase At5g58300 isoform X2 n=1 Tax=Helianthus annuus TaxID=4232 RepID=UPI000B8FDE7A|nr:probable inactive receptor kinase At5g58300 isoform X2 [Helianthus annuus]XP_035831434.1 probable inactive receptor kinase At5g58300 isoform X2 [Helianthus annuus]KAJ0549698.1 putative protein kinase RLK-Pelle-LRR-III family [Helianthus annuus]KAJ0556186.1 putative protein kinase RLK-Pelle-LRR-III family [Helianthus annuus]KAJ0562653.1 putative protein kinase RLK-Pelle-LRR-III family [Helianthus annuus]KAJ0728028.1 putative protein kinase RLK-Pelle-LRR-III family [Helianthus annuus]KAJ0730
MSRGKLSDRNSYKLLMCEKLVMKLCSYQLILPIFVLLSLKPLVCADLNSDKKALLEFVTAVPHSPKLKWGNASICTSWVGITCNSDGTRVISVRLPAVGLTGPIPPSTLGKLDALRVLSLRSNYLNGSLPSDLLSLPSLRSLFLQHNNFTTNIPAFFPHHLHILDLSFNSFTGSIPPNIQYLAHLYLQNNSLCGPIPDAIFVNLQHVNVSYNNLKGSIPFSLKTFPSSSFVGNPLLCGLPLKPCSKRKLTLWGIVAIAVVGGVAVILLAVTIVFCGLRKESTSGESTLQRRRPGDKPRAEYGGGVVETDDNKLVFFGSYINFDLEELLRASAEVIGKGSFGTTYKAVMEESMTVIVKRLNQAVVSKQDFEQQMKLIERVGHHQNVVPLRAFFYSQDEKLLVYDYYAAGSLMTLLHGSSDTGRTAFDWENRVKIAMGTARGIAHIHSIGGPGFTHGNIKSSNILIDHEMDACITDIGLVPIMPTTAPSSQSPGYRAPEVQETHQHSHKSDVYSFGVLLLELLTRKQPIQSPVRREMVNLPRWVQSVVREEWTSEVFDVELMRFHNIQEEMMQVLQIGLACVARVPENRPTIHQVVRMMEQAASPAAV